MWSRVSLVSDPPRAPEGYPVAHRATAGRRRHGIARVAARVATRVIARVIARVGVAVLAVTGSVGCAADPGYHGRTSASWIAQLGEADVDRRLEAIGALGQVLELQPNAPGVVDALVGALADTSDPTRVAAASALRRAARGGRRVRERLAADAVPALAGLLRDTAHAAVRTRAVDVLRDFGPALAGASAPLVREALDDPDAGVRRAAADGLGQLGDAAGPALEALARAATHDRDAQVRRAAVRALPLVRGPDRPGTAMRVTATLADALGDSVASVREAAAESLGALGPGAVGPGAVGREERGRRATGMGGTPVDPDARLRAVAVGDPSAAVRVAAVHALGLRGEPPGSPALRQALADPDVTVRREAAHARAALHRRGGSDPAPPEPSRVELCQWNPRQPGC